MGLVWDSYGTRMGLVRDWHGPRTGHVIIMVRSNSRACFFTVALGSASELNNLDSLPVRYRRRQAVRSTETRHVTQGGPRTQRKSQNNR